MKRPTMKGVLITAFLCIWVPMIHAEVNVLVAYYSQTGNTKQLAEAIGQGAGAVTGTTVRVKSMEEITEKDLQWANALAVGCPVHMSNIPHQVLAMMMKWPGKDLQNKVAAVFVTSGYMSTGEEFTQINLMLNLLMKRMIIVGGPDNSQPFGVTAVTGEEVFKSMNAKGIADLFVTKGKALGRRLAEIAGMIKK
jgi:NAD(P)H dehydrogenase (quinone)